MSQVLSKMRSAILRFRHLARQRRRALMLVILSMTLLVAISSPVKTVKSLVVSPGLTIRNGLSISEGRIAFLAPLGVATPSVYDTISGTSTSFAPPPGLVSFHVMISGDKIMVVSYPSFVSPATIYYCILPNIVPLAPCGPWTLIATVDSVAVLAAIGFPMLSGDIVVWPTSTGFSYYRFSTGATLSVPLPVAGSTRWLSTNGAIIAFTAKPAAAAVSTTVMYYDIASPAPAVVDTGLPGTFPSISQYTVAFNDNTTIPLRIRYYDVLRGISSTAGTGPVGTVAAPSPAIWGDRIAFRVSESDLGFDCNGNGTMSSTEFCMRYWNINPRPFEQALLAPDAAPPLGSSSTSSPVVTIYDKIIAFSGPGGILQYVVVPMKGDVNLDGKVNIIDIAISGACFAQVIKGTAC